MGALALAHDEVLDRRGGGWTVVHRFPPQRDGDLVRDGVCSLYIAEKLGVSQPTCGEHMKILNQAGLVHGKKIRQWVFYQRAEDRIAEVKELLSGDW